MSFKTGSSAPFMENGSGEFPYLMEWVQVNPSILPHNCEVKGDFQWAQMEFVHGNDLVRLHQEPVTGAFTTKLYREGHGLSGCNEQ
jgi:hypothetical protein